MRGANLLYHGRLDEENRFLFLSVHRNIVGTFLSIVRWVNGAYENKVETLVKLGNGYQDGPEALYGPVQFDPINLSFKLRMENFLLTLTNKENYKSTVRLLETEMIDQIQLSLSQQKIKMITRKISPKDVNFWINRSEKTTGNI